MIKNIWRKIPTWLKGGIIGELIACIYLFFGYAVSFGFQATIYDVIGVFVWWFLLGSVYGLARQIGLARREKNYINLIQKIKTASKFV